jgi:predicted Fe-S protein YdhL (DUF1289 family)
LKYGRNGRICQGCHRTATEAETVIPENTVEEEKEKKQNFLRKLLQLEAENTQTKEDEELKGKSTKPVETQNNGWDPEIFEVNYDKRGKEHLKRIN